MFFCDEKITLMLVLSVLTLFSVLAQTIDLACYAESIKGQSRGVDVTTQRSVALGEQLTLAAKEVLVLDMHK